MHTTIHVIYIIYEQMTEMKAKQLMHARKDSKQHVCVCKQNAKES